MIQHKTRLTVIFVSFMLLLSPSFAEVNPESIIQIFQRLEILEKKSRELTGENEILKHQLEQLKKVQKQGFLNVDEQIDELRATVKKNQQQATKPVAPTTKQTATAKPTEKAQTTNDTAAAKKPTPTTTPVVKNTTTATQAKKPQQATQQTTQKTVVVKTDGVKNIPATKTENTKNSKVRAPTAYEKETYQAAFNKMSSSPSAATRAFQDYIKLQPNSPLAANAQYWIGEIMYSHNNYKGAVKEFVKVLQKYKNSNKAPDAALKLGYSFYALKNWTYARRTFEDVLRYFPDNKNAVNLATKRLEKMKAAGH